MASSPFDLQKSTLYPEMVIQPSAPSAPSAPPLPMSNDLVSYLKHEKEQHIKDKLNEIKHDYKKYHTLKNSWSTTKTCCKVGSWVMFTGIEVASGLTAFFVPTSWLSLILIGAGGAGQKLVSDVLIETLLERKKKKFYDKMKRAKSAIDQLYIFESKALADNHLDETEMNEFNSIINNYFNYTPPVSEKVTNNVDTKKLIGDLTALLKSMPASK